MQETQVLPLGRGDPLGKEMATHSSTFAWRTPWTEEPSGLASMELQSWTRLSNFHLKDGPPSPSMLLKMVKFCSFLWLSNTPLYMCTTSSLLIHLLM